MRLAFQGTTSPGRPARPFLPLIALVLAQIGTTSDNAAMNIAVSQLAGELGASLGDIQLATTVYALTAGAFMIVGGLIGVTIGLRRTLRIGLSLGIAGELLCALAPSMAVFTWGGRLLFGLAASLVTPSVLGLVPALYAGRARAMAFGAIAGAAAIATVSPLALGALMDGAGFRVTFGFLGGYFAGVLGCTALLPAGARTGASRHFDFAGIVVAVAGLGLFLLGISRLSSWGLVAPTTACPFTVLGISPALPAAFAGLGLLVALMFWERRVERTCGEALIPSSFVKTPAVRAGLVAVAAPFFFMGAQGIVITPYVQLVAGWSALQTGLLSLMSGLPAFALAAFVPKVLPHISSRLLIRSGFGLLALSGAVLALGILPNEVGAVLYLGVGLSGLGVGLVNSQANNAVASSVEGRDAQQSGGIQGAARNVGMAFGIALAGTVLLLALSLGFSGTPAAQGLPESTRAAVAEQGASLMGEGAFQGIAAKAGVPAKDAAALAQAKAAAQADATRLTLLVLSATMVASLAATRSLAETSVPATSEAARQEPH